MTEQTWGCNTPQSRAFDFMAQEWKVHNTRRLKDGTWVEFDSINRGTHYLDGCTIIDTYDAILSNGELLKGITIRAYDRHNDNWSIVWLDNRNSPDFDPLKGRFNEEGIGIFEQTITNADGTLTHVRFIWDSITATTARWRQFFSQDGGETWDNNWIMEFSK